MEPIKEKKCFSCFKVKPIENFGLSTRSCDGYASRCFKCLELYYNFEPTDSFSYSSKDGEPYSGKFKNKQKALEWYDRYGKKHEKEFGIELVPNFKY